MIRTCVACLLWLFIATACVGQEAGPRLALWSQASHFSKADGFHDDFSRASRGVDVGRGVRWQNPGVVLPPEGSVERPAVVGAVAELLVDVAAIESAEAGVWKFRIEFALYGKAAIAEVLQQQAGGQPVRELRLIAGRDDDDGQRQEALIRSFALTQPSKGRWRVRYNYGVLEVLREDEIIGAAELNFFDEVLDGVRISQAVGTTECRSWSLAAAAPPDQSEARLAARAAARPRLLDAAGRSTELFEAGDYEACIGATETALEISREHYGAAAGITMSLLSRLAACQQNAGRRDEALRLHQDALETTRSQRGDGHPDTARRLVDVAICQMLMSRPRDALPNFEQAVDIHLSVLGEASSERANALRGLMNTLSMLNRVDEAIVRCQEATETWKGVEGPDGPHVAESLGDLAGLYFQQGDSDRAAVLWRDVVGIRTRTLGPDAPETLESRLKLADELRHAERLPEAQRETQTVVGQWERIAGESAPQTALARMQLAEILAEGDDLSQAGEQYRIAADALWRPATRELPGVGAALADYSDYLQKRGELDEAETWMSRALDLIRREHGAQSLPALDTTRHLAMLRDARGQSEGAVILLEEVLARQIEMLGETHADTASTLDVLGGISLRQKSLAKAADCYERALRVRTELFGEESLTVAMSRINSSMVVAQTAGPRQAAEVSQQALKTFESILGPDHPQTADAHAMAAGHLVHDQDWQAAERHFLAALRAEAEFGFQLMQSLPEAQALQYVDRIYEARDRFLGLGRGLRRFGPGPLSNRLKTLPTATDLEVYEAVWFCKALATRAVARQRPVSNDDPQVQALWTDLNHTRTELAALSLSIPSPDRADEHFARIRRLTSRKEQLQLELGSRLDGAGEARPPAPSLTGMIRRLPEGLAVVDIIRAEQATFPDEPPETNYDAFVYWNDGGEVALRWVDLGPVGPIDEAVTAFRRVSGDRGADVVGGDERAWEAAGRTVRELVWNKVVHRLGGSHSVVVIPDGLVARVPWSALPGDEPGTFLIDHYAVSTMGYFELQDGQEPAAPAQTDRLLLVGDVDYSRAPGPASIAGLVSTAARNTRAPTAWPALPGTGPETDAIRDLQSSLPVSYLRGPKAASASVARQLPGSRYVHLATHGFTLEANHDAVPAGSRGSGNEGATAMSTVTRSPLTGGGLVLAATDGAAAPDDGLLTGEEITGLDLRGTELVVLSACETGLGSAQRSEGVFGLQRAFHEAGARQVIASLWKVDDAATRALMIEFYQNLWTGGQTADAALRQAQQAMIQRYDPIREQVLAVAPGADTRTPLPPRYWAAFVVNGALPESVFAIDPPDVPGGFEEYAAQRDGYSVWLPVGAKPEAGAQEIPSALGTLTMRSVMVELESGVVLVVAMTDYPWAIVNAAPAADRLNTHAAEAHKMVAGGVQQKQADVRIGSHPGREVRVTGTTNHAVIRIYLVEDRIYVIAASVPKDQPLDTGLPREFVESFRLLN